MSAHQHDYQNELKYIFRTFIVFRHVSLVFSKILSPLFATVTFAGQIFYSGTFPPNFFPNFAKCLDIFSLIFLQFTLYTILLQSRFLLVEVY